MDTDAIVSPPDSVRGVWNGARIGGKLTAA